MLGGDAAAQDLVQDTFVKLWRSAARYDPGAGQARDVGAARRPEPGDRLARGGGCWRPACSNAPDPPREVSDEPGPDQIAETADLSERARRAMVALTDGQRAALELAYFGGKTSAEVAELEGIPLGTAKTRIRTALLKLREAWRSRPVTCDAGPRAARRAPARHARRAHRRRGARCTCAGAPPAAPSWRRSPTA